MTVSQKILLIAGLSLTILAMVYGFWHAVADEHPTLERMGVSLATAFAEAAQGKMDRTADSLNAYGETRFEYIRDVHTHSHLAELSTVLLVLGLFFKQLSFPERSRLYLASILVFGAVALPLGSFLEMFLTGPVPMILAMLGAVSLIGGLAATAAGLLLSSAKKSAG